MYWISVYCLILVIEAGLHKAALWISHSGRKKLEGGPAPQLRVGSAPDLSRLNPLSCLTRKVSETMVSEIYDFVLHARIICDLSQTLCAGGGTHWGWHAQGVKRIVGTDKDHRA